MYAEGRVEHQKRTQTATTLWPFGFVFGVQLGSLEKRKRGVPGTCRAASYIEFHHAINRPPYLVKFKVVRGAVWYELYGIYYMLCIIAL